MVVAALLLGMSHRAAALTEGLVDYVDSVSLQTAWLGCFQFLVSPLALNLANCLVGLLGEAQHHLSHVLSGARRDGLRRHLEPDLDGDRPSALPQQHQRHHVLQCEQRDPLGTHPLLGLQDTVLRPSSCASRRSQP